MPTIEFMQSNLTTLHTQIPLPIFLSPRPAFLITLWSLIQLQDTKLGFCLINALLLLFSLISLSEI